MRSFIEKLKNLFLKSKRNIEQSNQHKVLRLVAFFAAPFIILIALEIMHLASFHAIARYFSDVYWPLKLLLTYTFILVSQCIFLTLLRNDLFAYIITALLFYILSLVTYVTNELTGDPLLPSDLLLVKNVKEIASFVDIPFNISYIISFALMVAGGITLWFIRKKHPLKIKFRHRFMIDIAIISVFCIVIYAFCLNHNFRHGTLGKINVEISAFNPVDDLHANGVVLTFFPRIGDLIVDKPEDYNQQKIDEIYEKYKDIPSIAGNGKNPNVIIIQNEAWWDPTNLKNVEFSEDPMAQIEELGEKFPYGTLVTPVYAGGTCMPEFECLTGFSTAFLPGNSYPYIQHVLSETESIVSTYKKNGYETIALHPYHINFYNRSKAYPLLGFDKVLGIDDMEGSYDNKSGWYVSDEFASNQIISAYENKTVDRMFCFMVTMQNHGDYANPRYEEYEIEVTSELMNEKDLEGLKDYTQGVKDACDSFIQLTEYFENVDEPVLIAMYGDHLPLLGTDGSTYITGELAQEEKSFVPTKYDELYYTPYIVWANYDLSKFELPEYLSAGNLGLSVMEKASLSYIPWYQSVMADFYNNYPVYLTRIKMNTDLEKLDRIPPTTAEKAADFKLLQYDLLHFNRYSLSYNEQTENPE